MKQRRGFREIVEGWTFDDLDALAERIERAVEWSKTNGPLYLDEEATVQRMIGSLIARRSL